MAVDRLTEKEVNSLVTIYTPGLPKNMKGPGQPARAKASVTSPKNICAGGYQGQGSNTDRSIRSSSLKPLGNLRSGVFFEEGEGKNYKEGRYDD